MRAHTVRAGAALALTAGLVAGCESSPRRSPYADNPLVQARQPLLQPHPAEGGEHLAQVAQSGPRMVVVPPPPQYHQPTASVASQTKPDAPPYTPAAPTYSPPVEAVTTPTPPVPTASTATATEAPVPPPAPAP